MHFLDMLRMSGSSLWKRKIRTILTVLGVIIGTASIVVMISIGLGLNRATLKDMESYGSMTTIEVYQNYGYYFEGGSSVSTSSDDETAQYLSDSTVEMISQIDHVELVSPVLSVDAIGLSGKYQSWLSLRGMSIEAMENLGINVGQGSLPSPTDTELKLFFGNHVLMNFYNEKTGAGYWETGEVPDVDLINDGVYLIYDSEAYWASRYPDPENPVKKPRKYLTYACGIEAGGDSDYSNYSYNVYCDIEQLKAQMKTVFKNKPIPGQPTTKNGKAYKELFYDSIYVNVDDMKNVTDVQKAITDMGYSASSNMEWVEYSQKQYSYIQAVLGGIGAVSLFVAAIGIANTMMMSIYERTKEIGIMKVLGCNMRNIQVLFLLEAAFIGFLGGVLGVGLSYGVSAIINELTAGSGFGGMVPVGAEMSYIPLWLSAVGIGFSVVVGTLAGFFPSLRAMKLSPLAAIRNE